MKGLHERGAGAKLQQVDIRTPMPAARSTSARMKRPKLKRQYAGQATKSALQGQLQEHREMLSMVSSGKDAMEQAAEAARQEAVRVQLDQDSLQHQKQREHVRAHACMPATVPLT